MHYIALCEIDLPVLFIPKHRKKPIPSTNLWTPNILINKILLEQKEYFLTLRETKNKIKHTNKQYKHLKP